MTIRLALSDFARPAQTVVSEASVRPNFLVGQAKANEAGSGQDGFLDWRR